MTCELQVCCPANSTIVSPLVSKEVKFINMRHANLSLKLALFRLTLLKKLNILLVKFEFDYWHITNADPFLRMLANDENH